jgi:quercetin dioxygenase-like cupin family protein
MKGTRITAVAALVAAISLAPHVARTQQVATTRTDLQRHDLSAPGREVVQAIVGFDQGVAAPRHLHPGEEIIYVLEGSLEYQVEGQAPKTLKAGDVLFIPARTIHSAKNVGTGHAAELATYVVEKGKPLVVPAP